MAEVEKIDYSPDELEEIDRIVKVVTGYVSPAEQDAYIAPGGYQPPTDDLPSADDFVETFPAQSDDELDEYYDTSEDDAEGGPGYIYEESSEIPEDEVEDISDLIQEIETSETSEPDEDFLEDITEDFTAEEPQDFEPEEASSLPEDFDFTSDDVLEEPAAPEAVTDEAAFGDLDSLTSEEPVALDEMDIADSELIGGDIPDSDLSFEEEGGDEATPVSEDDGLSDVDLSGIPDALEDDFPASSGLPEIPVAEVPQMPPETSAFDDLDLESMSAELPGGSDEDDGEELEIEPLDDHLPLSSSSRKEEAASSGSGDGLELSEKDLKKLKKALILFNPGLRSAVKDAIVHDQITESEIRELADMIIDGRPEDAVRKYLEDRTGKKIRLTDERAAAKRVIHSRPEYSREGRLRQKRLLKGAKIFGIAAVSGFIITVLGYHYVYKPYMAKSKIDEGVEYILRDGDYAAKSEDYKNAERLAVEVEENYARNYLYGFNSYGKAYFTKKEYGRAVSKLNAALSIDPACTETLNNLGRFYSRVPSQFYSSNIRDFLSRYYPAAKIREMGATVPSQLDVAIDFYKRSLVIEPENVSAMLGIGNAYFYQGQYLKAKKYYEDIIKVDPDSVVGYSGLLNLYIERDAYDLTASTHAEINAKEILEDMPSPLLAKLANYYLTKRRTDSFNARVDHGVVSPRIINENDNTYPAVENVLAALRKRDSGYPPLNLVSARLAGLRNNRKAMERFLEKAIDASPNYFDALHLMGKHYFRANQPVKSYDYLNRAIQSLSNPPEFTYEDFYRRTEEPGETYAVMGDIFYYYFDKVKFRFGSLEDEITDRELEKLANYNVAREKYEKSLAEGYSSPELHYNLGRVYYLNRLYSKSLEQWLNLYEDFVEHPELMFALGNAFYHMGNYDAARGEYLKMINVLEYEAESIGLVELGSNKHNRVFGALSSAYNNLGAVYFLQNDESKSSISYWKSIQYAKKLEMENEFARVNLARTMNRPDRPDPITDENVPYSIQAYKVEFREAVMKAMSE